MMHRFGWLGAVALLSCFTGGVQAAITISPATLPNWTVNIAYSQTLSASGCLLGCSWSSTGTLPTGLSLDRAAGTISGTPTAIGSFSFTVTATDTLLATGSQSYVVAINPPPSITTGSLPSGTVNQAYSQTVGTSGGTSPMSFSVSAGTPPAGLTLSSSGVISGTPTAAGSFSFTITVTDSASATASQAYTLTINSAGSALQITTTSPLPSGTVSTPYSQTLTATGGTKPYSWSVTGGALPAGLALSSTTGTISGTPTTAGAASFTVQVADSASGKATQAFTLTINPASTSPTITTSSPLPGGTVGTAYSQTLSATGGATPYTWSVVSGALPSGVSLNASSGALTGTPSSADTFTFTAQVSDKNGVKASKPFTITIAGSASSLTITSGSVLLNGFVSTAYSQTLTATGGTLPYTWSVSAGALPGGVKLNASTGVISGTPISAGAFLFTARVTDSASAAAEKHFALTIVTGSSPQMTVTGVPTTAESAQQITLAVTLSSPYSTEITGQVTLGFQPDAEVPKDDPAIQFSSGGRVVNFTIPAGSTHAVFSITPMAFQTGTVAGTISLSFTAQSGGAEFPTTGLDRSVAVARTAAVIRSASVVKTTSGFQVQLVGFSNPRELDAVSLHFTPASGQNLQTTDLKVDLTQTANQWYTSDAATQFGSQFLLVLPFTIQGGQNSIASVNVQLQNGKGASAAVIANF